MNLETAQHQYDMMSDDRREGPTEDWKRSKAIVERCYEEVKHDNWLHKSTLIDGRYYTGPSVWDGMSQKSRARQERFLVRVNKVLA
jgi:hypothetical protein